MSEITRVTVARAQTVLAGRLGCPASEAELYGAAGYSLAKVIAHIREGGNSREIDAIIHKGYDRWRDGR